MLIEAHYGSVGCGLIHQTVFVKHVSREYHIVLAAPLIYRLCKSFNEQMIRKINIVKLYGSDGICVLAIEKLRQDRSWIKAVSLFKFFKNIVCISNGAGHHTVIDRTVSKAGSSVRLVGENSLYAFTDSIAATL